MSTIKEVHKTIDGVTYTATTLPATKGLVLFPRLVSLFGDGIVSLVVASDELPDDEDTDSGDVFQRIIAKLVVAAQSPSTLAMVLARVANTAADPEGIFKGQGLLVLKQMLDGVTADKVRIGGDAETSGTNVLEFFDTHFQGRLKHLLAVCVWIGQINFFGSTAASS